jgi:5-methylcytosine-specific restriction endonuclease McrA
MPSKTIHPYTYKEAMVLLDTKAPNITLHGYSVSTKNPRYTLFRENNLCVECGVEGHWMPLMTTDEDDRRKIAHFHLFSNPPEGQKPLYMSKDHIWPRSKNGPDAQWNYQTMCQKCQLKKAAGYPATTRFLHPHAQYTEEEKAAERFLESHFGKVE